MTTTQKLAIGFGVIGGVLALYFLATRKPSGGQVFGKVVDENGDPLKQVIVRFVSEAWTSDAETDNYGLFIKNNLYPGEYTVSFIKIGYYATDRTVTVKAEYATGLGTIMMYSHPPI